MILHPYQGEGQFNNRQINILSVTVFQTPLPLHTVHTDTQREYSASWVELLYSLSLVSARDTAPLHSKSHRDRVSHCPFLPKPTAFPPPPPHKWMPGCPEYRCPWEEQRGLSVRNPAADAPCQTHTHRTPTELCPQAGKSIPLPCELWVWLKRTQKHRHKCQERGGSYVSDWEKGRDAVESHKLHWHTHTHFHSVHTHTSTVIRLSER